MKKGKKNEIKENNRKEKGEKTRNGSFGRRSFCCFVFETKHFFEKGAGKNRCFVFSLSLSNGEKSACDFGDEDVMMRTF